MKNKTFFISLLITTGLIVVIPSPTTFLLGSLALWFIVGKKFNVFKI